MNKKILLGLKNGKSPLFIVSKTKKIRTTRNRHLGARFFLKNISRNLKSDSSDIKNLMNFNKLSTSLTKDILFNDDLLAGFRNILLCFKKPTDYPHSQHCSLFYLETKLKVQTQIKRHRSMQLLLEANNSNAPEKTLVMLHEHQLTKLKKSLTPPTRVDIDLHGAAICINLLLHPSDLLQNKQQNEENKRQNAKQYTEETVDVLIKIVNDNIQKLILYKDYLLQIRSQLDTIAQNTISTTPSLINTPKQRT